MLTIVLLIASNVIMTFAWYGHLKQPHTTMTQAIVLSWLIAFFEYCCAVPANRLGYFDAGFTGAQLKVIQEVITLAVFAVFAVSYLGESLHWNHLAAFFCLVGAVVFVFWK